VPEVHLADNGVLNRAVANQHVVNRRSNLLCLDSDSASRISLRIAVDQERTLLCGRETRGEVHSGRRFPNTALLVRDRYDTRHYR
jgi:hypothetical protein